MDEVVSPGEDAPQAVEAVSLLEKIAANPYDYNSHVAYITLLRKLGIGEDLRPAREVFHSFFPLSEDLWLQWLDDEEQAANTNDSLNSILALYDLAVSDYLSLNIWSRYLDFVESHAHALAAGLRIESTQFLDMSYKKAIAATQYHIPEGQRIWIRERDRRFKALADNSNQISIVSKTYLERLKVPHAQMEDTFSEFSAFVTKYINDEYETIMSSTSKDYGKALKALREREGFELRLQQSNGSLSAFSAYLDWERSSTKSSIPRLTQTLFERALVIHWQEPSIWQDYIYFAIQKKFDDSEVVSILERATRNCPWSGDLWAFYIRFLAQMDNYPFENLIAVKEKAVAVPSQPTELAKFWCSWLSLCRLAVVDWDPLTEEVEFLESELSECLETIGNHFATPDEYIIGRLMVYLKTQLTNEEEARAIWDLMAKANASTCNYWLDRIAWERGQGQLRVCHEMFKRNVSKIVDDPVRFCSEYLLFLNEEGSLQDLNAGHSAIQRISARLAKELVPQLANPSVLEPDDATSETLPAPENKRKLSVESETSPTKRPKIDHGNGLQRDREHATVLASNFPADAKEDQIRHFFKECGAIRRLNEKPGGQHGNRSFIVEFEKESDAASALTKNMKTFKGQEISVEKYSQTVLWVTNYPAEYDEALLRDLFSEFGTVVDIRLPSLAFNTKRRFAYVELASPNEATAALAANGRKLDDEHSLVVKLSNPETKKSRDIPSAEGRELFIVNIDFDASEADVRALLSEHGEIQSLRLLSKQGEKRHSGRAFVVYHSKDEADSALALNGTKFMSRDLKVQRSDPERAIHSKQPRESRGPVTAEPPPTRQVTIPGKAIGVIGIPDTVNEARIRSLVPSNLSLEKVEMRPENEGAILVFEKEADAGKAAMALEGIEVSGAVLRAVGVRELKQHHSPNPAVGTAPVLAFTPSSVKFGAKKKRGGGR